MKIWQNINEFLNLTCVKVVLTMILVFIGCFSPGLQTTKNLIMTLPCMAKHKLKCRPRPYIDLCRQTNFLHVSHYHIRSIYSHNLLQNSDLNLIFIHLQQNTKYRYLNLFFSAKFLSISYQKQKRNKQMNKERKY